MGYPETAQGFVVEDIADGKWRNFKKSEFKLKPFESHDIDVAIDACGVCASDVHTISGGWGTDIPLPLCVGHEVIGRAIRVGESVKDVKIGDRVGVGAQVGADLTCANCKADQENYCPNAIDAYGDPYPDGTISQGGYSSHIRAHEYFVFKIPEGLGTNLAAPMLCAGLTVYSPLVRLGAGPGKKVGIVGIGGLGHLGILFAKALGAEVYAISHSPGKKDDSLALGATEFISTKGENWAESYKFTLDFIINTADATDKFNLPDYFSLLKVNGTFHMVGFPNNPLPQIQTRAFAPNGCYMGASNIGNRSEMISMFELASKQNIKSWISEIPISEEGCKEAVTRVYNSKDVRYRLVLTGFDEAFGKRS
ncbi:NADPH-dependent medium chain alcohol dehydrogenase [Patellaria atrata CBS 101060]|uniref:alcohol dehydrogenase (NADP(+)) n=1 Tax=Patellaria atrata CBS 101060 TaxID=1346257 RepID=A0A9P4VQ79_9PEZI|nr:NADPH-dependent medium chain alcohol dehydrogenase [Patellaria atrata CBS 101060]